jgi:cytochrome P450
VALLRRLMADPRPVLDELRAGYGPVVGLGTGPLRMAIIGDPGAMRELFALPIDAFEWGHRFNVLGFVVGADSLIVSDGAEWKRRRSAVRSGFSRRRLDGWVDTLVRLVDERIDSIVDRSSEPPVVVDMYDEARELVQKMAIRTLFGEELAERSSEIAALFVRAQHYLESPALRQLPHPLPIGRRSRVRSDLTALRAIVTERLEQVRSSEPGNGSDVLAVMATERELSDDEIVDQALTLLGAGLDTTSATLAWMLWCSTLAGPALWQRVRAEADDVLTGEGPFDAGHLARLTLSNNVTRETTRLHPAGSVSPRMATRDLVVAGWQIPRNTLVLWSAHLAGRDPRYWERPLEFEPDRFDRAPAEQERGDVAWVPFGAGARSCVGFALAQMELTLAIARIAQRLDLTPIDPELPRAVGMVVNRPEGGAPMTVAPRHALREANHPISTRHEGAP